MNKYTKLTEVFQTSSVQIIDQKQTILENATQSIASRKDISLAAIGDEVLLCLFSSFKSLIYCQREMDLKGNSNPNYSPMKITLKL